MSKEEQIALELVKLDTNLTPQGIWESYINFLEKLSNLNKEKQIGDNDIAKLQDEIGTYKYIINAIKELIERDESNFVLKEDLLEKIGGLI